RQAIYWIARAHELGGDVASAVAKYKRLHKVYGETAEGLAAKFAESDCRRRTGDIDEALAGYRSVLAAVEDPQAYDNPLLPLGALRKQLTSVYQQLVKDEFFEEGLSLVELFEPVFGRALCVELRAKTHQRWGEHLL